MFYLFIIVALLVAACGQQNTADTVPTVAFSEQTAEGGEVQESTPDNVTPEPNDETPEPTSIDETPEPDDETPEPSIDEQYDVSVSYGLEADSAPEAPEAPPEGSRWFIVAATVANEGGNTIEIDQDELALIDSEGNRYEPLADDPSLSPSLLGTFEQGESVLGLVRFAIPNEATASFLEVCLDDECNDFIRSEIP